MFHIIEMDNIDDEELQIYACTSEVQLLRYFEPAPGLFIAESPRVVERALAAGYEPISILAERSLMNEATGEVQDGREIVRQARRILERCGDIPVYAADMGVLARITGYHLTQGFLCAMRRRELPTAEKVCSGAARIAVLEDIVNPTNVGAIFRSAAALGFDAVLLTRACCDPLYRRAIRVSMGTVFQIPWTYLETSTPGYVQDLNRMGFSSAAMALREDAVPVDDPRLAAEERLAVILGTEGEGLRAETIEACDYTVKIPMANGVDSLNVAAASAVAFWALHQI